MEPVIIQVLRHLRSIPRGLRREEISARVEAQGEHLEKAIDELVRRGMIATRDGLYCYELTPAHEDLFHKLVEVYESVHRKPEVELIFRGLLLLGEPGFFLRYKSLRRILEDERYATAEEVNTLLAREVNEGNVERIRICFGDKWRIRTPFCLPLSYVSLSPFIPSEYERFKEEWRKEGFLIQEEDYLKAKCPCEITRRATTYLEEKGSRIKDEVLKNIRSEVYDNWYRSRWFFQMTHIPPSPTRKLPIVLAVQLPPQAQ